MTGGIDGRDAVARRLLAAIASIPISDTHEHLLAESTRLRGAGAHDMLPCTDAALLLWHYCRDDLRSAGMPEADLATVFAEGVDPAQKWVVLDPWWQAVRHTGFAQAVRRSVQIVFGEPDLDAASFVRISERMRSPEYLSTGINGRLLGLAGIETVQTQSLEAYVYRDGPGDDTQRLQDLSIAPLTIRPRLDVITRVTGVPVAGLDDMLAAIDVFFDRYAARAIAVKDLAAYDRRLNFGNPRREDVEEPFRRYAAGAPVSAAEMRDIEDFLTHRVVDRAAAHNLPVKFHCGYHFSTGSMPLGDVRQNAGDITELVRAHPGASFVLMHMGYPYEAEYAALAKHYPNVYVDLCWAWILNPVATQRFVGDFLMSAPQTKLLGFGGDHTIAEPVVGHAAMAREGLALALADLVAADRMTVDEAERAARNILRDNARRLFSLDRRGVEETPRKEGMMAQDENPFVQVRTIDGRRRIVDEAGKPLQLRGVGIGGWMLMENFINGFSGAEHSLREAFAREMGEERAERFFDRLLDAVFSEEDVKFIKSTGANHIRLSVNYRHLESDDRPFEYLEKGFARIDEAIGWAKKHGLKVVLDLHALPGWQNPDWHCDNNSRRPLLWQHPHFQDRTVALWKEIARRYKDDPTVIAYDVCNEPATRQLYETPDWGRLNSLYARLISGIREIDPRHIIVVEGDMFASRFSGLQLPEDDNIVVSSHNYTGEGFGPGDYPGEMKGRMRDRTALRDIILNSEGPTYGRDHDRPVWVGEFGSVFNGPRRERDDRLRALADEISVLEEEGIGWCMWTYKDVGVMGWTTPKPSTPFMRLVKPFLDLKRKLGVDSWMGWMAPTSLKRQAHKLADDVSRTGAIDATPEKVRELIYTSAVADHIATLMQPRYARLFAQLTDEQLDQVADSFRLQNCTVNRGITDIVGRAAARGAAYRGFVEHSRLDRGMDGREVA